MLTGRDATSDRSLTFGRTAQASLTVLALSLAVTLAPASVVLADSISGDEIADLAEMDIEDLFDIEITSLTKSSQRLSETPAAIFVVTNEDLRRSGVRSIPEALRMVPGLQVARISGNRWAISSRGFNSIFSDKMLVMIDGRSVYTPLYAGVYWDVQDTLLEDIDRIEVIRGPGGTLWGANATNGVINIVTKSATETTGGLVTGGGGKTETGFAGVRYGHSFGDVGAARAFFKFDQRSESERSGPENVIPPSSIPEDPFDGTKSYRAGFRSDWDLTDKDHLTVQADGYRGWSDTGIRSVLHTYSPVAPLLPASTTTSNTKGGNVLARWTHTFSDSQDMTLQFYYDNTQRADAVWEEKLNTWDVDFNHHADFFLGTEVTWGLGYRRFNDEMVDGFEVQWRPPSKNQNLFTGFVQFEGSFFDDRLSVYLGTKAENNDTTGWEFQPSIRGAFNPAENQTVWASVTRAVRTPSRSTDDMYAFPSTLR